jgi:hypothetical protein
VSSTLFSGSPAPPRQLVVVAVAVVDVAGREQTTLSPAAARHGTPSPASRPSAQQRKGSCLQAGWAASRAPVLRRHYVDAGSLLNDLSEPIKEQMFALGDRRAVWDFPLILFAKLLMFRESCGSFESNPAFVLHLRSQTKSYSYLSAPCILYSRILGHRYPGIPRCQARSQGYVSTPPAHCER